MKKNLHTGLFVLLCFFLLQQKLHAQQRMQYSQFLQNAFLLNPSLCGMESYDDLRAGYAKQWSGFEGPAGTFFTYQHYLGSDSVVPSATSLDLPMRGRLKPMDAKPVSGDSDTTNPRLKQGWGLQIFNEGDDIISNSELSFAYAAHLLTAKKFYVSGGLSLGFRQNRFNPEGIRILNQNDMVFAGGIRNVFLPVINVGFSIYNRKWFASYSSIQVLNNKYSYDLKDPLRPARLQPHHYLMGGYRFRVGNQLSVMPSVLIRYAFPSPPSVDLNVMMDYKDLFRAGLSYRNKESVIVLLGFTVSSRVVISYAFDFVTSPIKNFSSGTHGIIMGVRLGGKKSHVPSYFW